MALRAALRSHSPRTVELPAAALALAACTGATGSGVVGVRVATDSSPSLVVWKEIEVIGAG